MAAKFRKDTYDIMANSVLLSLIRINSWRIRALKTAIAPYGYTGTMHLIVLYIRHHPGSRQEAIAEYYSLDKSSVARDARKLEELHHIVRHIDPENRRQYQLDLTPAGQEFVCFLDQIHDEYAEKLKTGFQEEEWAQLEKLLKRMEEEA